MHGGHRRHGAAGIVTKILAGRPKDIEDIRGILVAQVDRLNVGQVRDVLGMLEHALGVSDLIPAFQRLLTGRGP